MLRIAILMYYHLKTEHRKVRYSDESGIQVFGIQMVAVPHFIELFQNFFDDKNEKERRQRLEKSNRDELDLSNLEAVSAGLSPMQRIDLINKKIKPDGR